MADPSKARTRWEMSWPELAVSIGDGQPGSPDWEQGLAVLQARAAAASEQAAEAAAEAAVSTRDLMVATRRLMRATWVMAFATILVAISAFVAIAIN